LLVWCLRNCALRSHFPGFTFADLPKKDPFRRCEANPGVWESIRSSRRLRCSDLEKCSIGFAFFARLGLRPSLWLMTTRIQVVGIFWHGILWPPAIPVHSGPLTPSLLESLGCDFLMIATPDLSPHALHDAVRAATLIGSEVAFCPPARSGMAVEQID